MSVFSPIAGRSTGISFKPAHADELMAEGVVLDFVEIHAENAMGLGGPSQARLRRARERFPFSVHGVGLSIGGAAALDPAHLARFCHVVEQFAPSLVSEHLAWSTHDGVYFNDLLPIAYDDTSLSRVVSHVQQIQERLKRRLLIENPSTYVALAGSAMEEADFLAALVARSGCGMLLDLNNVVVSQHNRGESPFHYLSRYPLHAVGQIHLAGHARERLEDGTELRIDDHGSQVDAETWSLYAYVVDRLGPRPTLIEWDTDVPELSVLMAEVNSARDVQRLVAA